MTQTQPYPIARNVIGLLGGPSKTGAIVGRSHSAVCKWMVMPEQGGTGGLIPAKHHLPILQYARAHNIPLGPGDLIPTDPAWEVAA